MFDDESDALPNRDEGKTPHGSYLQQAGDAFAAGDAVLAMHLYLAAFEQVCPDEHTQPTDEALAGLKQAWTLACTLKERSIAEYVFERIEPYLSAEETTRYARQLQDLALDKLAEFGLPRDEIEGLAEAISQDLSEDGVQIVGVNRIKTADGEASFPAIVAAGKADKNAQDAPAKRARTAVPPAQGGSGRGEVVHLGNYDELVGFDHAVDLMRDLGIGMDRNEQFQEFVSVLNARHGLDAMPAADSLLFRCPAREDANRFMMATAGELGLPAMRMRMEEGVQGAPVLCVMTPSNRGPKLNGSRTSFEGPAVLMIEDLDLWLSPTHDGDIEDFGDFLAASLSRGAREAVSLIRSGVDDPEVYVLASAGESYDIDPFFLDMLTPFTVVDIDLPTDSERAAIWRQLMSEHPSLRSIDRKELVRLSRSMARYDIYAATREAIEEEYRRSLSARRYEPVRADNLYDKLAAFQPLDSPEYRELEDAVLESFRRDIDDIDELLRG